MTLLKLFNKTLKELPGISEDLQNVIQLQEWPKAKYDQAISIIRQIEKGKLNSGSCYSYSYITLAPINITLSPHDCGINSINFDPGNILEANKYIINLLTDINSCSSGCVRFYFGGHDYEKDKCTFTIDWEF